MSVETAFRHTNDLLAFVLELAALAALAWWGFTRDVGRPLSLLLGVAAPLAAAAVWGAFAAPKATYDLPLIGVLGVKAAVFASAAVCLAAVGHRTLGVWFAGIVILNTIAVTILRARQ